MTSHIFDFPSVSSFFSTPLSVWPLFPLDWLLISRREKLCFSYAGFSKEPLISPALILLSPASREVSFQRGVVNTVLSETWRCAMRQREQSYIPEHTVARSFTWWTRARAKRYTPRLLIYRMGRDALPWWTHGCMNPCMTFLCHTDLHAQLLAILRCAYALFIWTFNTRHRPFVAIIKPPKADVVFEINAVTASPMKYFTCCVYFLFLFCFTCFAIKVVLCPSTSGTWMLVYNLC